MIHREYSCRGNAGGNTLEAQGAGDRKRQAALYAHRYPESVAGLVMVDAASEWMKDILSPEKLAVGWPRSLPGNHGQDYLDFLAQAEAMEKRVRFYSRLEPGSRWPSEVEAEFAREGGKHGLFTFEEGSDREKAFLALVSRSGVPLAGRSEWIVSGEDLFRHPFHYLTLKSDKDYPHGEYTDDSKVCGGDENVWCRTGGVQVRKVTVDPKKAQTYDIMLVPGVADPRVILVTRRLKEILEGAFLTGFRFEACLIKGKGYPAEETGFGAPAASDAETTHFQLVPLLRTKEPAQLGRILRPPMRCSKCRSVYQYWADRTPAFRPQALHEADFQHFNRYVTENEGEFRIPGEVFVVSARFLRVLLDGKATGLAPFLADPPIKHAIVHLAA